MARVLLALIGFYRRHISPHLGAHCRYIPTCSEYAAQAIERFGALRGSIMAAARVLRCNPFIPGGWDRVPRTFTIRRCPEGREGES